MTARLCYQIRVEDAEQIQHSFEKAGDENKTHPHNCFCFTLDWPILSYSDWLYAHGQIMAQRLRLATSPAKGKRKPVPVVYGTE